MRWSAGLCWAALVVGPLYAGESADPLRLVPRQADVVVRLEPRRLADAVQSLPAFQELLHSPAAREGLASTNAQRFVKLIAYYEKELGAPWPELLDQLAGGGIVVATKLTRDGSAPVLAVIQSRDRDLLKRAVKLVGNVVQQELARNDAAFKPKAKPYRGFEITHLGDVYFAVAGSALLLSNQPEGIELGLDLYINGSSDSLANHPGPEEAATLLPAQPLASLWLNLKPVHQSPEGQELFKRAKGDTAQLILVGGLLDVIGRSPFMTAGFYRTPQGFTTSVRMPAGRNATPEEFSLHLAPADQPGSLPPLEPADVLYSSSFYLDLGALWSKREKILSEGARKQLDRAEQQLGRFLAGRKLSELLTASGPYHRVVVAAQTKPGYSTRPGQLIPAFAVATSMRDPAFGQTMNSILRTVAFLTGTQARLKLVDETIDGVKLVGYRFPETGSLLNDTRNLRFAFSPCFATVGDQFFVASTIELGREMVGLLKRETTASAPPTPLAAQSCLYAAGGAALAEVFQDQQVTQTILERGVSIEEAQREVQGGIDFLRRLGVVRFETDYRPNEFRFDIRWEQKK